MPPRKRSRKAATSKDSDEARPALDTDSGVEKMGKSNRGLQQYEASSNKMSALQAELSGKGRKAAFESESDDARLVKDAYSGVEKVD